MLPGLSIPLSAAVFAGALAAGSLGFFLARPWTDRIHESVSRPGPSRSPFFRFWPRRAAPWLFSFAAGLWLILAFSRPGEAFGIAFLGVSALFLIRKTPAWKRTRDKSHKRRRVLEAFPQALEMTIQSLQAGQTVPQALAYLSQESPPPLKEEFQSLCLELELGSSPEEAMQKFADRYPHPDLFQFADSYRLSRLAGANLVHLYRVQWEGIEERHRILRRLESMTAQARLSGLLMGVLPFLLLAALFLIDPEMPAPLFDRPAGWAVLGLAAMLESIGFLWIRRLMRLEL